MALEAITARDLAAVRSVRTTDRVGSFEEGGPNRAVPYNMDSSNEGTVGR